MSPLPSLLSLSLSLLLLLLLGCAAGTSPAPAVARGPTHSALGDLPDPFVLVDGDTIYVYATNGQGRNVQLLMSSPRGTQRQHQPPDSGNLAGANASAHVSVPDDLASSGSSNNNDHPERLAWAVLPDAMPSLAPWVLGGFTWAPEVVRLGSKVLLYYTARHRRTHRPCIGVAVGKDPQGPFIDVREEPLLCQEPDGTIDASPFVADGRVFLYVKRDGNCCGRPTVLYAQELSADGLALWGDPVALLQNDPAGWEGGVIEAPSMVVHDGRHFLFYSGNDFASAAYGVGVASCDSALGPCRRLPAAQPLLRSRSDSKPPLFGPGHQALFRTGTTTWMAYHGWGVTADGQRGAGRFLHIDRVDWSADGNPVVRGPTLLP